ncbi:MAG TPA: MFS transporter [Oscillospiraceae bacterium]|nr:MFS transporter [Oscillospiraceae bacterium]HPS35672.1 MFS transporter [Oscillospiraceae bacterium]
MQKAVETTEKRARRSWYFYDFGNSAYASVVLLAVYSAFFKNVVVGGAEGTRLWGVAVGAAAILVAIISPILGTIADFTKSKKKFLLIFTVLSVVFTAMLFFVRKGDVFTGMLFFILAEIGYRAAQVFYDSLLTDVSTPESIGSVSGKGWAIGMVGGIVALLIVLLPIQLVGKENQNQIIPYTFLITAVIYLVSSIPSFLWVVEKHDSEPIPAGKNAISLAFHKLAQTFRSVKQYKEFIKYTVAFLIYNDGIMMLMDFAAIIGATLFGMQQIQLILFVILIQFSGTFGALLFGRISDKKSSKEAIIIPLLILIAAVTGLFFVKSMILFFVIGFIAGFSLSGVQAVSRTMVSQLSPSSKSAEFYGFLSVAGRTSTFVGPLVFGTISFRAHNWYTNHGFENTLAEQYGLLWAIGSIILFLVVGLLFLLLVKRVSAKDPIKF